MSAQHSGSLPWRLLGSLVGTLGIAVLLWQAKLPLGIPGEWEWKRHPLPADFWWNLPMLVLVAGVYFLFVWGGTRRLEQARRGEVAAWIAGLILCGFAWLWSVQECAPAEMRLSKAVWVLYFPGPSGYFSEARDHAQNLPEYLAGYQTRMEHGDVLHLGTHPPGLIMGYRLLWSAVDRFPALFQGVNALRPESTRMAFHVLQQITARDPHPATEQEITILWGAFLCMQLGCAATVWPLYVLLRGACSRVTAWWGASLWPLVPAAAVFLPKSDAGFPVIATAILALWCLGWEKNSLWRCVAAGCVAWLGLFCSLAFLPVLVLMAIWTTAHGVMAWREVALPKILNKLCRLSAGFLVGLIGPILVAAWGLHLPLLSVWRLNLQNHARFYEEYQRSYLGWLLVNPMELAIAAGPTVAVMCVAGVLTLRKRWGDRQIWGTALACGLTWAILWISGKNSGEAARLWIFLIPWGIWLGAVGLPQPTAVPPTGKISSELWGLWGLQLLGCLLVVTRVVGFDVP